MDDPRPRRPENSTSRRRPDKPFNPERFVASLPCLLAYFNVWGVFAAGFSRFDRWYLMLLLLGVGGILWRVMLSLERRWGDLPRPTIRRLLAYSVCSLLVLVVAIALMWPRVGLAVWTFVISCVMVGGFGVFGARRRWIVGDERRCARCDYEVGDVAFAPDLCPECGADWLGPGGTMIGRPIVSGEKGRAGLIVGVLGLLLLLGPGLAATFVPAVAARALPNAALISRAADADWADHGRYWQEVLNRRLRAGEVATLATRVLDKRKSIDDRGAGLPPDAERWIQQQIDLGQLPADLVERYFRETFELELVAPNRVRVGERAEVRLDVAKHSSFNKVDGAFVWTRGFESDLGLLSNMKVARRWWDANGLAWGTESPKPGAVGAAFVPQSPGTVHVRLRCLVVVGYRSTPSGEPPPLSGASVPVIDPNDADWSGWYDLERTIQVDP